MPTSARLPKGESLPRSRWYKRMKLPPHLGREAADAARVNVGIDPYQFTVFGGFLCVQLSPVSALPRWPSTARPWGRSGRAFSSSWRHQDDTPALCRKLAEKVLGLRIFRDENDKMNKGLSDVGGSVLVVSQFTLYGDCSHGRRPTSWPLPGRTWPSAL